MDADIDQADAEIENVLAIIGGISGVQQQSSSRQLARPLAQRQVIDVSLYRKFLQLLKVIIYNLL